MKQKIIDFVRTHPGCDVVDIVHALGSAELVLRTVQELRNAGYIEKDQMGVRTHLYVTPTAPNSTF